MVYLPARALNSTCESSLQSSVNPDIVRQCQLAADQPYCWPPNGTRICAGLTRIPFYWPPMFYHENAYFYVDFGTEVTEGPENSGKVRADRSSTNLTGFTAYTERISNSTSSDERLLRITIREWHPVLDSITSTLHHGPTLTIVPTQASSTISYVPGPRSSTIPDSASNSLSRGETTGVILGAIVGVALLLMLCFKCCGPDPGREETARVRRQEARRVAAERAALQPQVDEIKACVARGEVWTGRVPRGGMWATDFPARPARSARASDEIRAVDVVEAQRVPRGGMWAAENPARPARVSDEIRAVDMVEAQRVEEQCIEARRRIEELRIEELRIAERREEIARESEVQPPPYEAGPPKYTP
ncbi:hypothetical protein C7974DRAFT_452364 [Boeremia exigua]|uniref:uncharacterized protein n=1 Tax=Boeremia exigua TaxID=749465 RepID=UPI001E8EDD35|nr:uncharacterized protein C7974DRAFT_452364 [Boeremia exigua]KAH6633170.1 hypothetical protein C7974DRAFT_452364 [Boeremia exigua]